MAIGMDKKTKNDPQNTNSARTLRSNTNPLQVIIGINAGTPAG